MDSFLRKYKIIDNLTFKLNCDKSTFIDKFKENVKLSDLSFSPFEAFSSNSKLYKGNIQHSTFKIQKTQQLFNNKKQSPIASGKITEYTNEIKIELEISGVTPFIKFFFIFLIFFYLISIIAIGYLTFSQDSFPLFPIPFIIIHGLFMMGIPFIIMKFSVKNFKQDIEREFHFWLK